MSTVNTIPWANTHSISLQHAVEMTGKFRGNREAILDTEFRDRNIMPFSETFDRQAMDSLLSAKDCAGVRIYYGMDDDLKIHAILVAVNEKNEDLLPSETTSVGGDGKVIIEEGQRCPGLCPPPSPLKP
jgi:hypothetical protein